MIVEFGFANHLSESHRSFGCVPGDQCGRCKDFAKDVGRTLLGRSLAVSGSLECCSTAQDSSQRLERSVEVRAARRAASCSC